MVKRARVQKPEHMGYYKRIVHQERMGHRQDDEI